MKVQLTAEQKAAMKAIFDNMNKLREDKNFMEQLEFTAHNDIDEDDEDMCLLVAFPDDLRETVMNNFHWSIR